MTKGPLVLWILLQLLEGSHLSLAFKCTGTILPRKDIESQQGLHFFQVQVYEINALRSNQEETDSRVVLYLHQAVKWDT